MSREKQIEEMAEVYYKARLKARDTLGSMNEGEEMWYSKAYYEAGYRKQSENERRCGMINKCKQNVKYKPFEWADVTLIIQFDFCPNCEYFESCYDLDEVAQEYDGKPITVRGASRYISADCGKDLKGGE